MLGFLRGVAGEKLLYGVSGFVGLRASASGFGFGDAV